MNKTSKSVLTVLFAAVFCMLIYCIVQISQTQQGILFLTEKLALEVGGKGDIAEAGPDDNIFERVAAASAAREESESTQATTPAPTPVPTPEPIQAIVEDEPMGDVVYWVPGGSVWHVTPDCGTLSQSNTILSGTIEESGKPRACYKCR